MVAMAKNPAIALTITLSFFLLISLSQAGSSSPLPESDALDRQPGVDLTQVSDPKDIKILLPTEKLPQTPDSVANLEVNTEVTVTPEEQEQNLPASGHESVEDVHIEEPEPLLDAKHENVLEVKFYPRMDMPHHRHAHWAWMSRRFWFPKRCGGHRHHHMDGRGPDGTPPLDQGEESSTYHRLAVREINKVPFFHHQMREGGERKMFGEFKRPHFGFFHHHHHDDGEFDEHHHRHHDHDGDESDEHHHHRLYDHEGDEFDEHHHHHHHDHEGDESDEPHHRHHDHDEEGRERHMGRKRFGMWRKMGKFVMTEF